MYRGRQTGEWSNWAFVALGLPMLALGIAVSDGVIIALGVVYAVGMVLYTWMWIPSRFWRRVPELRSEQVVTVGDEGITVELVHSSSRTSWDYWSEAEELAEAYLIAADRRGWIIIPRRAFSSHEDEDAFRQITARHLPASFARRRRTPA